MLPKLHKVNLPVFILEEEPEEPDRDATYPEPGIYISPITMEEYTHYKRFLIVFKDGEQVNGKRYMIREDVWNRLQPYRQTSE
jgi:hypothetical protein